MIQWISSGRDTFACYINEFGNLSQTSLEVSTRKGKEINGKLHGPRRDNIFLSTQQIKKNRRISIRGKRDRR